MFQEKLEIGAVEAVGVEALRPVDGVLPVERVAQVGAEDVLVAHLCSEGRAPQRPVEVGVEVESEDLRAVVVVGHFRLRPAYQFEAILLVVPVDGRTEVEESASVLTLQRQEGLEGVLKLVVEARAIVSVRPVVLAAQSCLPPQGHVGVVILSLIESLCRAVVAVERSRLAALVAVAAQVGG